MNKRKAFTLIELLAVVVILGLLVTVAYPAVNKYINNTKSNTCNYYDVVLYYVVSVG